jgi:hypothetical protein
VYNKNFVIDVYGKIVGLDYDVVFGVQMSRQGHLGVWGWIRLVFLDFLDAVMSRYFI